MQFNNAQSPSNLKDKKIIELFVRSDRNTIQSQITKDRIRAGQTDDSKDYASIISPDESEYVPISPRPSYKYKELPQETLEDVQEPTEMMEVEAGQLFLPDMIDLREKWKISNKIDVPEDDLFNTTIPNIVLSDENSSDDSNVQRVLWKARQVEREVTEKLHDETYYIPKIQHQHVLTSPNRVHKKPVTNLIDLDISKKDLPEPLEAVYAPLMKQKQLIDMDVSYDNLPDPLNPIYVPLEAVEQGSTTSTLGTSSSEALFRLNLPKDFIPSKPTKNHEKRFYEVIDDENLWDTSIPDENFFYDSDPEKYYKLIDISSSSSMGIEFDENANIVEKPILFEIPKDRFTQLQEQLTKEDLYDIEMPSFSDVSSSSSEVMIQKSAQKKEPVFTVLPFPPSVYRGRKAKLMRGRPISATGPPQYLYTLDEEVEPIESPTKVRRRKPTYLATTIPLRKNIPLVLDTTDAISSSSTNSIQRITRSRISPEVQRIIDKYSSDFDIKSPQDSAEEAEKVHQLQKCLEQCEKQCVEQYERSRRKMKEEYKSLVSRVEDQIAQDIVDKVVARSPIKVTPKPLKKDLNKTDEGIKRLQLEKRNVETMMASQKKLRERLGLNSMNPRENLKVLKRTETGPKQVITKVQQDKIINQPRTTPTVTSKPGVKKPSHRLTDTKVSVRKRAGFVCHDNSMDSHKQIQDELLKLFFEFSEKLKTKGLLPEGSKQVFN